MVWIPEFQHVGEIGCGPFGIHASWGKQLPTAGLPTSRRFSDMHWGVLTRSDEMLERRQSQSLRERCTDLSISSHVARQRSMSQAAHEGKQRWQGHVWRQGALELNRKLTLVINRGLSGVCKCDSFPRFYHQGAAYVLEHCELSLANGQEGCESLYSQYRSKMFGWIKWHLFPENTMDFPHHSSWGSHDGTTEKPRGRL